MENKKSAKQCFAPVVVRPGFEPRPSESESEILAVILSDNNYCKIRACSTQKFIKKRETSSRFLVGLPGFEPRQTEPKSVVLPLYYRPIRTSAFAKGVQK